MTKPRIIRELRRLSTPTPTLILSAPRTNRPIIRSRFHKELTTWNYPETRSTATATRG